MNTFFKRTLLMTGLASVLFFSSCEEELKLPDNTVAFESDQLGFTSSETELTVLINLSREATAEGSITVGLEATGLTYATDFTTEPAATANVITLSVPAAATSASIKVKKIAGVLLDGDEKIKLTVQSVDESLVLGEKKELTLTFSEIVATSGGFEVTGGGPTYPNKVFIDLSANRQTAVSRTTWDLAFFSGEDFRVVLNSPNGMLARATTKTDMNLVTAADTAGFKTQFSIAAIFAAINTTPVPTWIPEAINWMDNPTGDITKTAIASISATASENKVYIINRGSGPGTPATTLGMKKIRVIRNGNGYTLQHADISATTFSEIQITKNTATDFQYVSFATGAVTVEPGKGKWDIAWNGFTNAFPFGTGVIPYYFQDVIVTSRGAQTAKVMITAAVTYEAFTEANIAAQTFSTSQVSIGSDWRSGGGPPGTPPPSARTDRFYIIKDAVGNYYKLKFTALTAGGERGKPKFEFVLVKKGS